MIIIKKLDIFYYKKKNLDIEGAGRIIPWSCGRYRNIIIKDNIG